MTQIIDTRPRASLQIPPPPLDYRRAHFGGNLHEPGLRRACCRGNFALKRPPPTQRLDTKWWAFVDALFELLPLLEDLTLEVWGHRTLVCMDEGVKPVRSDEGSKPVESGMHEESD